MYENKLPGCKQNLIYTVHLSLYRYPFHNLPATVSTANRQNASNKLVNYLKTVKTSSTKYGIYFSKRLINTTTCTYKSVFCSVSSGGHDPSCLPSLYGFCSVEHDNKQAMGNWKQLTVSLKERRLTSFEIRHWNLVSTSVSL